MAEHDGGGAAYPQHVHIQAEDVLPVMEAYGETQPGLTKRELIAAMAMQGELASQTEDASYAHLADADVLAQRCICFADALLSELAKEGGE